MPGTFGEQLTTYMEKYKTKEKYFTGCKAVLHVGGHVGQEAETYKRIGVAFTFVEPVPRLASIARGMGHHVLNIAVSDFRGLASFNVARSSERSSLLEAPSDVMEVRERILVPVMKLEDIQLGFDGLSIDAQGSTYAILSGGILKKFNVIVCEVSERPRYKGERTRADVSELLRRNGFEEVADYRHKTLDIFDTVWKRKM